MELNIERKPGGGFDCIFFHNGQEYLGSLIFQTAYSEWFVECIIFKTTNGQFSFEDALGVCQWRDCELSADALRERIEDFCSCN